MDEEYMKRKFPGCNALHEGIGTGYYPFSASGEIEAVGKL